jgi:hypothetical protein
MINRDYARVRGRFAVYNSGPRALLGKVTEIAYGTIVNGITKGNGRRVVYA